MSEPGLAGDITVDTQADVLSGSEDNVNIESIGGNATADNPTAVTVTDATNANVLESATIDLQSGSSNIDLSGLGTGVESVTVTGSGDGNLAAVETDSLTAFDASDASGNIEADLDDAAADLTVSTGSGDDTIRFAGTLNADDTVDLGDGTDRAAFSSALTIEDLNLTNVEEFEARAVGGTVDFDNVSGTVLSNDANTDILDNVGLTNGVTIFGTMAGSLTVNYDGADAPGSNSDEVTVTLGDASAEEGLTGGTNNLVIDDIETINLVTTEAAAGGFDLDADSADTINVSGDQNLEIDFLAGSDDLNTFDASEMSGDATLNFDAANLAQTGKITVTGTANNDVITINDTDDQDFDLVGGAGADTFDFTGVANNSSARVVYNSVDDGGAALTADLAAGDEISATAANEFGTDATAGSEDEFITISGGLADSLVATGTADTAQNGIDFDNGTNGVFVITSANAIDATGTGTDNTESFAAVDAAIGTVSNEAVGDTAIIGLTDDSDTALAVYAFQSATADNDITEDELQLLGVAYGDGVFSAADITVV
ncbi:beta strand repeat-containing protein [Spiribacter salinus]|uniref:beta strand repeat-containing protein n=1 Tax=Spiribacter salinus TaxID=1335746 RepID=UPI001C945BB3|nr:hypothetical protein [Spiribacter salinus]